MNRKKQYVLVSVIIVLTFIITMSSIELLAKSLADWERDNVMKTKSPMDAAPVIVEMKEGIHAPEADPKVIDLNSGWKISSKEFSDKVYDVSVPFSLSSALYQAGAIENPLVGLNDAKAKELTKYTWNVEKTFTYNGDGKNVRLSFDGVADRCRIYLNGTEVGSHQGMFGGPYIDVSDHIRKGENTLKVVLLPALHYANTVVFNCSYAWHYADIPPIGIWQDVYLEEYTDIELDHPFITTVSHETGTMDMSIDLVSKDPSEVIEGTIKVVIRPKNFIGNAYSLEYKVEPSQAGNKNVRLRFDLPEFKLWWPNGYGEQNLYTLETYFTDKNGVTDVSVDSFAVRTLDMKATWGSESTSVYNRTVVINGKSVFMKGAGWCTIDVLMDFSRENYDKILSKAHAQGLNFLRAWGGGLVETDEFYDLCDEYGICVYQEWPCCWDSQQSQPKEVLYETIILNTKRIRNHPSLIVYGGGNEGTAAAGDSVINNMGKYTYQNDGTRDFWRQDGGHGGAGMSHDHIWWGGQSPEHYANVYANMNVNLHEYGLGAMMNMESIAKYATKDEMAQWPVDPEGVIAYHTSTFNGMKGWNPSPHGYDIDTYIWYAEKFAEINSLEDLVVGSQLAQAMGKYFAIQNARINFPNVSTVCYYKISDIYPGGSWSVIDYYGSPKIAHYFIQDAFQTLMATGKFDRYNTFDKGDTSLNLPIYILDDTDELKDSSWKVTVKAYDDEMKLIKEQAYEGKGSVNSSKKVGDFNLTAEQTDTAPLFIVIDLYKEGNYVARSYAFMNAEKEQGSLFYLPKAKVSYKLEGNTYTITNESDIPAVGVHFICPQTSDSFIPEDNYFWLEPGETKVVTVNSTDGVEGLDGFNMVTEEDTKAPEAPTDIKAESIRFDSLKLIWEKAKDDKGIYQYKIYVDGQYYGYTRGTATTYIIEGLSELTEYSITITAVDVGMNESAQSKVIKCKTEADRDQPYATGINIIDLENIEVIFNRPVRAESAGETGYYILNMGASVTSAALKEDGVTVALKVSGINEAALSDHSLTVMGVQDTTYTGNHADRRKFRLDTAVEGMWDMEDQSNIISINDSELIKEGKTGSGIKINKGDVVLANTDFNLENSTIAFWMKAEKLAGFNVLLSKGAKAEGHFEIYTNEGILMIYGPEIGDVAYSVNLNSYEGEWVHLCFTFADKKAVLYINGEKSGMVKLSGYPTDGVRELVLGSLPDGQFPTAGIFDELIILRSVISQEGIQSIYNGTFFNDVSMDNAYLPVDIGKSGKINMEYSGMVSPSEVSFTWTSSDENVALVDQEGNIIPVAYGKAVITASSSDGRYIEKCVVEVCDLPEPELGSGANILLIAGIICGILILAAISAVTVFLIKSTKRQESLK